MLEQELAADPDLKSKDSREKIMELAENGLRIKVTFEFTTRFILCYCLTYYRIRTWSGL